MRLSDGVCLILKSTTGFHFIRLILINYFNRIILFYTKIITTLEILVTLFIYKNFKSTNVFSLIFEVECINKISYRSTNDGRRLSENLSFEHTFYVIWRMFYKYIRATIANLIFSLEIFLFFFLIFYLNILKI